VETDVTDKKAVSEVFIDLWALSVTYNREKAPSGGWANDQDLSR